MIQVNHLEKSFEGFHALKGVDMHVEKGCLLYTSDAADE